MQLKLYSTLSRQLEAITPADGEVVKLYTCGPTVYNYAHIGNFRTYVFEDLLRRSLKFFGYKIEQTMNLTDVDDKTINGANAEGIALADFTKTFKEAFFADLETLGIEKVEHYPEASAYIPEMIEMISALLHKGFAYKGVDGSIYFSIERFSGYGKLSHLNLDDLKGGASGRVATDEYEKENVADFVLWKAYDELRDKNIFWDSPFGEGRPGWHIECSAMSKGTLGKLIDIHAGGIDNMFPHHENEIAQSECCNDHEFVRVWVHAAHLLVDGQKMSKSKKNFFTLRDLLEKGYSGRSVRFALMQTHYRTPLNFTFEALDGAVQTLSRLDAFKRRLEMVEEFVDEEVVLVMISSCLHQFSNYLADDLNIAGALGILFDFIRAVNVLCDEKSLGSFGSKKVLDFLKEIDSVLGLFSKEEEVIAEEVLALFEKRKKARKDLDWALSDSLRKELLAKGYEVEDTKTTSRLIKKP